MNNAASIYIQDDLQEAEMKRFAESCYDQNMRRYSFSYSPRAIYMSGLDRNTGIPHANWKTRMSMHHPSRAEFPELYQQPLFVPKGR